MPSARWMTWSASWAQSNSTVPRTRSGSCSLPSRGIFRRTTALRPSASNAARCAAVSAAQRRLYWNWRFSFSAALRSPSISSGVA